MINLKSFPAIVAVIASMGSDSILRLMIANFFNNYGDIVARAYWGVFCFHVVISLHV